jgi:acetyltransferase-like isoleucine patch superfamily enzyme
LNASIAAFFTAFVNLVFLVGGGVFLGSGVFLGGDVFLSDVFSLSKTKKDRDNRLSVGSLFLRYFWNLFFCFKAALYINLSFLTLLP